MAVARPRPTFAHRLRRAAPVLCVLLAVAALRLPEAARAAETADLMGLSIEELMAVEVTSVAKAPQRIDRAPAAVYVITREDIRRSGATTIAEVLRQVPGMQVARVDGTTWAISARGFAERFAGKLLVLIDGRTVYSTQFAGVYWDLQDLVLSDIERIEVIRGPGGALWGANAVNGVVNIITRNAADTVGTHVEVGAGSREEGLAEVRQGAEVGDHSYLRVYGKAFDRDSFEPALGVEAHDAWDMVRWGFRWDHTGADALSVQGGVYGGEADQTAGVSYLNPPGTPLVQETAELNGQHLLADWRARRGAGTWRVKAYVDHTYRADSSNTEGGLTQDLEVQHDFAPSGRHRLTWGGGARRLSSRVGGTFYLSLTPPAQRLWQWDGFAQDRVALRDHMELTLGAKVERMTTGDVAFQPNGRLLWRPAPRHTLWGAVSRAVEVPSRTRVTGRINPTVIPGSPPTVIALLGNPNTHIAHVLVYEAGYRGRPIQRLSLDVAGFYNVYDHLGTREPETPFTETTPAPSHTVVPLRFDNRMDGESYGAELAATWQATGRLRMTATYSWLKLALHLKPGSLDTTSEALLEGGSPQQQARLAARLDLPRHVAMDASAAFTDELPGRGVAAYTQVDARVAWTPVSGLTLSLAGENLTDPSHREFGNDTPDPSVTEVPRVVFARVTWEH